MEPSSESVASSLPATGSGLRQSRRYEDIAYQAVTIGAILLVLGSVWVF